jgi:ATP-dependent helicase YprA (DUF1998 family)
MDPIALAEEIKQSYAISLIGSNPEAMKRLLTRFGDPNVPLQAKLGDVVKMRGPYLQALNIPQWGQTTWQEFASNLTANLAPHGLEPEVVETFAELGFRRLYEFQEQGMQAILDDQHTLVVAGTGRGKTESWMLPLLHYIIARKRGKLQDSTPPDGTKALLIYPTKALAQDQLKRLLNYLFRLNQKLEPTARVSVGIFDGDTPSRNDIDAKNYLFQAFQYFRCPVYDATAAKCQSCGQHLIVPDQESPSASYTLALPRPECRPLAPLGFVRLTREDIVDSTPDIVLTNPDMLNLRLLNINGDDQRRFLIEQPKFIVLDEVHIYTELFGSFTSFIVKRLRHERAVLNKRKGNTSDTLRFIAASATVANEQDLFRRLCNLPPSQIRVVKEESVELNAHLVNELPAVLTASRFETSDLTDAVRQFGQGQSLPHSPYNTLLGLFDLQQSRMPPAERGEDALQEFTVERMFEKLTATDETIPELSVLRALHRTLAQHPMTPAEFRKYLSERFVQANDADLDNLAHNFITLGVFSGLLESRAHLFAWPIDGYYTCLGCGRVYETSQAACSHCGCDAVHKVVLCADCGEEAVESWFCPHCRRLYPLSATVEGEDTYYRGRPCLCTGKALPTLRVIWKPYYRCDRCDAIQRLSPAELDGQTPPTCRHGCGGQLRPVIALPWVCTADHPHLADQPPATCSCGARGFVLAGLIDIDAGQHCSVCKGDFLDGVPHAHDLTPGGDYQEYKLLDATGRIRRPANFRDCVPCYHPHAHYHKIGSGARYDTLMRSPANAAVTSAQYALRYLVGQAPDNALREKLRGAKILSFSDSYSDMEQLAHDFDEPERNTFTDQAIVAILERGERSLQDLTTNVIQGLQHYGELLRPDGGRDQQSLDWLQYFGGWRNVADEVERRFLVGNYGPHFQPSYRPWLVREAIADIRLTAAIADDELPIIAALIRFNRTSRQKLMDQLLEAVPNYAQVLERLQMRGIILVISVGRGELLCLNPAYLTCNLVDETHAIPCDESRGHLRGLSTLEIETGGRAAPSHFGESYRRRANLDHPHFSRVAYRIARSRTLLLRSEVYKGDIKKEERRNIEYNFKEGADIHFLSSGPAMEVGIDIGDLDLLLLYGTPPNINAYLQRIGRAGRRSKQSLVLSISKRNPIDFYYYRQPLDLIKSAPQPVPLNEHNQEVMKVSLTWALLDFVAANFWIPWLRQQSPDGITYSDGQNFSPAYEERPADISPLTSLLYSASAAEIGYGYPLQAISTIVHDRRDQAQAYLASLLAYRLCNRCGAYIYDEAAQTCLVEGCSGRPVHQADRYHALIDTAIDEFPARMVDFLEEFRNDLWQRRKTYNRQAEDAQDELMRNRRLPQDRRHELTAQVSRLMDKVRAIDDLISRLDRMTLVEAQAYSAERRYAYQIRTVSDSVEVTEYSEDHGKIRAEPKTSRDIGMAVKEYHPYAVILSGRRKIFTRAVHFDDYRTDRLRERLTEATITAEPLVCAACGRIYPVSNTTDCTCGRPLQRMNLKVLRSAEVQSTKLSLGEDPEASNRRLYPGEVFRLSDASNEVRRTYANLSSKVVAFTPTRCFSLENEQGQPMGMLDFGQIEVVTFADSCTVVYESGLRQPWPQVFEICGEEDCHGVIVQSRDQKFCALDPVAHQHSPRQVVRLGHLFATEGIRLRMPDEPVAITHAVAHGLRMGLEKVGGVLVRNIHELLEQDTLYIYDAIPGGGGVTSLLVQPQGDNYPNFQVALDTIRGVVEDCRCQDGCPHCLYQYGCATWNAPATLTRQGLRSVLSRGLRLRSIAAPIAGETLTLDFLAWPPEEDHLRQAVWQQIGLLELCLRHLVRSRYEAAHGETWPGQFFPPEKLAQLQATQSKEERQFASSHHLLDYTYLQDLLELVNIQWMLFQDLFGDGKKAKGQLTEKVQSIVKVRNPLAHNRAVPEDELKQVEVYCADVLAELQAGAGVTAS